MDYAAGMTLMSMRRLEKAVEFFKSYSVGLGLDVKKTAQLSYKITKLQGIGDNAVK